MLPGRAERPLPVGVRDEVQAVLRRRDCELSAAWLCSESL
jgi:hypothetical protein